ncbi:aminopeptidase Ey-like isoform X2 [Eriocheir sinensis]|uniref:aminopeptidase Ey-like isoform X2 n=1 Tax=Eriocheir sinensis TaxID=95602 RepID=UPI0021C8D6B4|nr:aminopeptidase Ey-like isoform X2 [Eriocheir sinensis]
MEGGRDMNSMTRSSDVVAMDLHTSDSHMVSFGKRSGCFVSRSVVWLFLIFFVSALVATGLLVYFFAPHVRTEDSLATIEPHIIVREIPDFKLLPTTSSTTSTAVTTTTPTTTTTDSPATTPAADKIDVRLPRSLRPLHYLVKLQPLINGNLSILGYVEVEMEVLEATTNITLHIADIITHNDTIKLRPLGEPAGPGLAIAAHQYDAEREFYVAQLKEPLRPGGRYVLSMHFLGLLNDLMKGFYRSTYRDADGTEKRLAATQFQATDARRAFPCFDEPGLKATFEVHLARQDNMTSLSNMPIKETLPMAGQEGWLWDHYQTTVNMSTYLLAFVVSDFVYLNSTTNSGTLFRTWAREAALDQAKYSSSIGPPILDHFEEYFSQPYPLPKQDMIALPDFSAGAMENWGLVTYRETALLYDPTVSTALSKFYIAAVVAHELAHQWFGNLVTPRWWTDLWLNEGFASYVEYIGMQSVEPSWGVMEMFVHLKLQSVMDNDNIQSSHPIRIEVHNPNEIGQIFDQITYNKGSTVIRMMNHFLTEAVFRRGVNTYLEEFKYDSAEQDDLWRHLTEAAHAAGTLPPELRVKAIMDTWTLQMGYPVIRVERSPDGTSASVSQERFLLVKDDSAKDTHDYKWWVPLTYTGQQRPDFSQTQPQVWMKDSEAQVTVTDLPPKDQWVIFNLQETGYYKVNYDQHNWNLLTQQLLNDHSAIHTVNRAQIIDDAFDLARAGQLNYTVAFKIFSYLYKEKEYLPWKAATGALNYVISMFKMTGAYGSLQKYIRGLVRPVYDMTGFEDKLDDPLQTSLLRGVALNWACAMEHQPCLDTSSKLFRQWMLQPDNATIITPNVKWVVYCRSLEAGGEEEWSFAWDRYLKSNVGSEKTQLLSAMGCTKKQWLLSRYLDMAFDENSGIRKQDSQRVFAAVAHNSVGRRLAWDYLRTNWAKIYKYFGGKAKQRLITAGTKDFNTEQHLNEVLAFKVERGEELAAASRTVDNVVEQIKNNMVWIEQNYQTIVAWLNEEGFNKKLRSSWHEKMKEGDAMIM